MSSRIGWMPNSAIEIFAWMKQRNSHLFVARPSESIKWNSRTICKKGWWLNFKDVHHSAGSRSQSTFKNNSTPITLSSPLAPTYSPVQIDWYSKSVRVYSWFLLINLYGFMYYFLERKCYPKIRHSWGPIQPILVARSSISRSMIPLPLGPIYFKLTHGEITHVRDAHVTRSE